MARVSTLLVCVMLLFSIMAPDGHSREARSLGISTTLRTFGEDIKSIEGLGAGAIRIPLQWQFIKIRPGEYDWSTIDRLTKTAQSKQIEILFNIRTTFGEKTKKPKSKRGSFEISPISPESMDTKESVRFLEILANRYRGQGVNYEIENEVNEASWRGTLEEYLELLKTGYDVIKKADPQAKVLPSAMGCGIVRNFQPGLSQKEAWKWHDRWLQPILSTRKFDVMNVHNYYFPNDIVANGLTFRRYLEHIRELMKRSGLGDHPIWITETGYVSSPANAGSRMDNGSFEKQAKWLAEGYQQAFEFGVERIYWLLLRDRNEPYFGSMGLEDSKGNPRPARDALKQQLLISP